MKLSIIIPVFNEKKSIESVIQKVTKVSLPKSWIREIVVVDDGSNDGTGEILKKYNHIFTIITHSKNKGKGAALRSGFNFSTGDYILIQDADLEYDANDYINLLEPIIIGNCDIVFGSRILQKNNVSGRRFYFYGGVFLTKVFNLFFNTKLTDVSTCYKVFNRKYLLSIMEYSSDDFAFDFAELTYSLISEGAVVEVPINYNPRNNKEGKKLKIKHGVRILFVILKLFFKNIYKKFK